MGGLEGSDTKSLILSAPKDENELVFILPYLFCQLVHVFSYKPLKGFQFLCLFDLIKGLFHNYVPTSMQVLKLFQMIYEVLKLLSLQVPCIT